MARLRMWLVLGCVFLGALACNLGAAGGGASTPTSGSTRTVTIRWVAGTAEVRTLAGEFIEAQSGYELTEGEEIHTYRDTQVLIELDDGTLAIIASDTLFVLSEAEGTPDSPITRFFVNVGEVFSIRQSNLPPEANYEIETPVGTAAIRGSSMSVSHGLLETASLTNQIGGESRVTCLEGECSANEVAMTDGQAVDIGPDGQTGSVEAMTDDDYDKWRDIIEFVNQTDQVEQLDQTDLIPVTAVPTRLPETPDLVGLTEGEASNTAEALGLALNVVDRKPCVNVDEDQITSQSPLPGEALPDDDTINAVLCTGPPGTGDVQITLTWATTDDLDLVVVDPNGEAIYYLAVQSSSGGELDVDANAYCEAPLTTTPVENIFWDVGEAPTGTYTVAVAYSISCGTQGAVNYSVQVSVDGEVEEFSGTISPGAEINVTSFTR